MSQSKEKVLETNWSSNVDVFLQVGAGPMMLKEVLAGSRDNLLTDVRSDVRSERTSADTSSLSRGTGMTSLDMSMMSTDQQRTEVWESVM